MFLLLKVYIYDLLDVPVCLTRGSSYPDTAHRSLSDAIGTSERPNDTLEWVFRVFHCFFVKLFNA